MCKVIVVFTEPSHFAHVDALDPNRSSFFSTSSSFSRLKFAMIMLNPLSITMSSVSFPTRICVRARKATCSGTRRIRGTMRGTKPARQARRCLGGVASGARAGSAKRDAGMNGSPSKSTRGNCTTALAANALHAAHIALQPPDPGPSPHSPAIWATAAGRTCSVSGAARLSARTKLAKNKASRITDTARSIVWRSGYLL